MSTSTTGGPKLTEAYKAIIDFNKTIISIASTILAALISLLVFQGYPITPANFAGAVLIFLAILCSLLGFGKSIRPLQTDIGSNRAKLYSNVAGYLLLFGIALLTLIHKKEETSLEKIMSQVEKTGRSMHKNLDPIHCLKVIQQKEVCVLKYRYDSLVAEVTFSFSANDIINFEETRQPREDSCRLGTFATLCCCICEKKPKSHSCTPSRPGKLRPSK